LNGQQQQNHEIYLPANNLNQLGIGIQIQTNCRQLKQQQCAEAKARNNVSKFFVKRYVNLFIIYRKRKQER